MVAAAFVLVLISAAASVTAHGAAPHGNALKLYRRETQLAYRSLERRCGAQLRKRKLERAIARRELYGAHLR